MYFKCNLRFSNKAYMPIVCRRYAKIEISRHRLTYFEEPLNAYLIEHYGYDLIKCCLLLIDNAKFTRNFQGQVIVTFIDPELDNLAKLITYGTRSFRGSKILQTAFYNT